MRDDQERICISLVTHVVDAGVCRVYDRLRREAPADHDVRIIVSSNGDPQSLRSEFGTDELVPISRAEFIRQPYPGKCFETGWAMSGNLDLVFLEFARRFPRYDKYWFVEYDVHWEGDWSVFFEHFRGSRAALLAASVQQIDEVPHKLHREQPRLQIPPHMTWLREKTLKAFLPICRLSRALLDALDADYRSGLGGHYELTIPTVAAHCDLAVEDYGGRGRFVRAENVDRFYFARGSTYSHSPGTFVFRPGQHPIRRPNTLWHPVKPAEMPLWHPMQVGGKPWKRGLERVKPLIWRAAIRWWFATRWRPLTPAPLASAVTEPAARRLHRTGGRLTIRRT